MDPPTKSPAAGGYATPAVAEGQPPQYANGQYAQPQQQYAHPQQQYVQPQYVQPGQSGYPASGLPHVQPGQQVYVMQNPQTGEQQFVVVNPNAPQPQTIIVQGDTGPYVDDYWCALIGLLFSWIPLVGFFTCCINAGAPAGSLTRRYAIAAGVVAAVVLILYIVLGGWFGNRSYYY